MKFTVLSLVALSAFTAGATDFPNHSLSRKAVRPEAAQIGRCSLPSFQSEGGILNADFTTDGSDALAPVVTFGFDTDFQGWTTDPTTNVTWSIKKESALSDTHKFGQINPETQASLFVEGPYQVFKRETSSITSPAMEIPANGSLSFYIGYSLNYDDACRLSLKISTDDFETSEELWNSKDGEGEKPWQWRHVELKLDSYIGKNVKFRFTYGPGSSDNFNTGGYMGDFTIDDFVISGRKAVESVAVMTGDIITLLDLTSGTPTEWSWNFPGGVPETSSEANPSVYYTKGGSYDISLTVKDAEGNVSTKTRKDFVTVTGTAPVAKILPPATFRLSSNRKYLVAPLAPVTFKDASTGFPTEYTWGFSGVLTEPTEIFTSTEPNPTVSYAYLHDHNVVMFAQNELGLSQAECEVTAEYSGTINNLLPSDRSTVFDMEDWGVFPGSNTRRITAYAERFSAPSVPVRIFGAYVFFNEAQAEELVDQITNVGVHLYTSKDGKPDKCLDSWWWQVFELDTPSGGQAVGTSFPFTEAPFVSDEFFIVVDGIPTYKEGTRVSFGMADFRAEGGTAMMLKDGEWMEVADYFPAGKNHTSFMIYPEIAHSVMSTLNPSEGLVEVGADQGETQFEIFSYMGYETPVSDSDWLRVTSEPNGLTVDTIKVAYDKKPSTTDVREGNIYLTDGATTLTLTVRQQGESGVTIINGDEGEVEYVNLQGIKVTNPAAGQILIRKAGGKSDKIVY
ncbi:MAG: PKD domain-containing protein [Muribaculaceae bacterium]|nr:PKD domain-containing protein [Muribaculaceae bacterium]